MPQTMMNNGEALFTVRPYEHADRDDVFRIMADTAFFGEPVEAFLEDRNLFCEAFCAYYTDLEPERDLVAQANGRAVGTLLGCADTAKHRKYWRGKILPEVVKRWLQGRYRVGPLTRRYVLSQAEAVLKGERAKALLQPYPAHLHVNVEANWRGQGLGKRLIEAFLDQLRELGVPGVHLETTSLNRAATALYTRLGFQILDARMTQAWGYWEKGPVENRLYGMGLS